MEIHLPHHQHKDFLVVIECLVGQIFLAVAVEQGVQVKLVELVDLQILEYQELEQAVMVHPLLIQDQM
tara:strand:- start:380 stop:583 length:204 start_codon:yes stop_codon:yes gene_type:complete